jgi:signal transduction histidine kinase
MYTENNIHQMDKSFMFIGSLAKVLDCEDNYAAEKKLRAAKVITHRNNVEAETCCLYITFSTMKAASSFINRLNKYLEGAK